MIFDVETGNLKPGAGVILFLLAIALVVVAGVVREHIPVLAIILVVVAVVAGLFFPITYPPEPDTVVNAFAYLNALSVVIYGIDGLVRGYSAWNWAAIVFGILIAGWNWLGISGIEVPEDDPHWV